MSWQEAFRALPRPADAEGVTLGATLCPGCRLSKLHDGSLAVAIEVAKTGSSTKRNLENIAYVPPKPLEVSGSAGKRVEDLAVLSCRSDDSGLQDAFLRIATALLGVGEGQLSERELETRIDELVRLFRALGRPATQTVQGLWGELAVIMWSADPRQAVIHWHSSARAQHDFDGGADRLEVKSCATGLREHAVRLDQLRVMPGGHTLFASVLIAPADDGHSVSALADAILARVHHHAEVRRRLQTIIVQSLGGDWRDADTRRFSLPQARLDLRFYEASTIPTVAPPPAGVRQVSFVVDLTSTDPVSIGEARGLSPFFAAMLPAGD